MSGGAPRADRADVRVALLMVAPAAGVILLVALIPIAVTGWEALHLHDLRLPWLGRPFIGIANFQEAIADPRFRDALLHTVGFAAISVPLELSLGLALALTMHHVARGRGLVRVAALLPWAIPTVVAALVWRFMFDGQAGILNAAAAERRTGRTHVRLVRAPAGRVGSDRHRRRLEDDAVRGDPAARRAADDRPDAL